MFSTSAPIRCPVIRLDQWMMMSIVYCVPLSHPVTRFNATLSVFGLRLCRLNPDTERHRHGPRPVSLPTQRQDVSP